jgi:hypothetical protein
VFYRWQNVKFAERVWLLVFRYPTPTEKPAELGNPTSEKLR